LVERSSVLKAFVMKDSCVGYVGCTPFMILSHEQLNTPNTMNKRGMVQATVTSFGNTDKIHLG